MKKIITLLLTTILLMNAAGCASGTASAASEASSQQESSKPTELVEKVELIVSAAASLTDCMNEIKGLYESEHPGVMLTFNFGSSGALQQQIEQGAPVDLFFSAGKKQMNALIEQGLVDAADGKDILENKVVLIVPQGGTALTGFEALKEAGVEKIGVGEPGSVPVGQYTEEIFQSLGLTDVLKEKLVYAKDVREVLSWVETGNVQAGIVYETDAKISDKVTICATAPEDSHKPVVYPVGVMKQSKQVEAAKAFMDYLFTDVAKVVFEKYGFSPMY